MVEFALCFSVLMAFIFILMELCMAFYSHALVAECVREGTRYAIVRGSTCVTALSTPCTASAAQINAYVSSLAFPNIGGGRMTVNTTFLDGNQAPGSRVQVAATYVFPITLPFVPGGPLTMSSSSQMYILQ